MDLFWNCLTVSFLMFLETAFCCIFFSLHRIRCRYNFSQNFLQTPLNIQAPFVGKASTTDREFVTQYFSWNARLLIGLRLASTTSTIFGTKGLQ